MGRMFERVTLHASDREASVKFYETVLPAVVAAARAEYLERMRDTSFVLASDTPERVRFRGARSSFSLVAGEATAGLDMVVA